MAAGSDVRIGVDLDRLHHDAALTLDLAGSLESATAQLSAATTSWAGLSALPSLRLAAWWAAAWEQGLTGLAGQVLAWVSAARTAADGYHTADLAAARQLADGGTGDARCGLRAGVGVTVMVPGVPNVPAGGFGMAEALLAPFARFQAGADVAPLGDILTQLATDLRNVAAGLVWQGPAGDTARTAVQDLAEQAEAAGASLAAGRQPASATPRPNCTTGRC